MDQIPLSYSLGLSALLFGIGVAGVLVRRNAIVLFMCVELMLNAVNLAFVALAPYAGLTLDELREGGRADARRQAAVHAALFVLGFSLVFITFGATATAFGQAFRAALAARCRNRREQRRYILSLALCDLIRGVAAARPEWQLVMIGPVVKIDPETLPLRARDDPTEAAVRIGKRLIELRETVVRAFVETVPGAPSQRVSGRHARVKKRDPAISPGSVSRVWVNNRSPL